MLWGVRKHSAVVCALSSKVLRVIMSFKHLWALQHLLHFNYTSPASFSRDAAQHFIKQKTQLRVKTKKNCISLTLFHTYTPTHTNTLTQTHLQAATERWKCKVTEQQSAAFWHWRSPDRPHATLIASSSRTLGLRLLFMGSGGACCPSSCRGKLARRGLGLTTGGPLKRLEEMASARPSPGCSACSLCSCLLNLLTMLFTFPSEGAVMLSGGFRGGEVDSGSDGLGGISGLGLASSLMATGEGPRWGPSWVDMAAGVAPSAGLGVTPSPGCSEVRVQRQQSASSSSDEQREGECVISLVKSASQYLLAVHFIRRGRLGGVRIN